MYIFRSAQIQTMFGGLIGLERNGRSPLHRDQVTEGGKALGTSGSCSRTRLHRKPGHMRGELPSPASGQEEGRTTTTRNAAAGCPGKEEVCSGITDPPDTLGESPASAAKQSFFNQHPSAMDRVTSHWWQTLTSPSSLPRPPGPTECSAVEIANSQQGQTCKSESYLRCSPDPSLAFEPRPTLPRDSFNSSFSFIQQSLSASQRENTADDVPQPTDPSPLELFSPKPASLSSAQLGPESTSPDDPSNEILSLSQTKPTSVSTVQSVPKLPTPIQPQSSRRSSSKLEREELLLGEEFWQVRQWGDREATPDLADCDSSSLGTEFPSSLSVNSDASITSGYESATPPSDQGWDNLARKYEGVLQDCLQSNRTNTKIESMMLRLQRLQQKAILDDDYDSAERFGKKLEELSHERGALKLGLPSREPSVALFLQHLRHAVDGALQRAEHSQRREVPEPNACEGTDSQQAPQSRRERLIQEKHLVETEIGELQRRLQELRDLGHRLEQQIRQEDRHAEAEELEDSVLRGCTVAQLRDMSRALQDLVNSKHRTLISVSPSPSVIRLQEQEQALNLSVKEATAKVVMSQRLGAGLRRKVCETETQLLALHEAKLAAISGNDFGSAKELKAEMKALYQERDRLEGLAKRLHSLSSGNSQELARMKQRQQQLRQELEQREAQHEIRLKENTSKYIELLEDRLHSCGCPAVERVWEADLEACHLFLRGTPSYGGPEAEDLPNAAAAADPHTHGSTKEEEDCAMLTALGGRWCPEANLQNSEFTKKLEEFLFCMEENHAEDGGSEAGVLDLTEHCELIGDRLMTLEDELQTAVFNRDQALTQSLEKEVREVKATLQTMLAQLREEEEAEEAEEEEEEGGIGVRDVNLAENGIEEEEEDEDEDQYFSDSWDI